MTTSAIDSAPPPRTAASVWLQALRLYSVSASVIPVLFGIVLAARTRVPFGFAWGALALLAGVLLHLATNLLNDVGDYRSGVDRAGVSEGSGVLTGGLLPDSRVSRAGYALLALGVLAGLPIVLARGSALLVVGAVGVLGAWGYTAGPKYKYLALGDVSVFVLMGPLMTVGGFIAVAGRFEMRAMSASIPIGLLVVAILHVNNLRDRAADAEARIQTVARMLGDSGSKAYLAILLFGAYVALVALAAIRVVPWEAAIALVTLPIASKLFRDIVSVKDPVALRALAPVEQTAKLHMLFGLLMIIGTAIGAAIH